MTENKRKSKNKIPDLWEALQEEKHPPDIDEDPYKGVKPICIVAVNAIGYVKLINILNYGKADSILEEMCEEYLNNDLEDNKPGIIKFHFGIEESRDYWGEYDSWSTLDYEEHYIVDIEDKRHSDGNWYARTKIYDEKLKEYNWEETIVFKNVLFVVGNLDGGVFILDIPSKDGEGYEEIISEFDEEIDSIDNKIGTIEDIILFRATMTIPPKNAKIELDDIKILEIKLKERE